LETLARHTRKYLELNCKIVDLHIIKSFPFKSCETSSLVLGKVLSDAYPYEDIYFVKGTNTYKYEMHFWIEVGDLTFDITADQFEGIVNPIYGKASKLISSRFGDVDKEKITTTLTKNDFATSRAEEMNRVVNEIRGIT
jgi:hypothetical protein